MGPNAIPIKEIQLAASFDPETDSAPVRRVIFGSVYKILEGERILMRKSRVLGKGE